jgi:hypothetical protein
MEDSPGFAAVSSLTDSSGGDTWDTPSVLADFSAGQGGVGRVAIKGLKTGRTPTESLINSNIAAWKLGTVG